MQLEQIKNIIIDCNIRRLTNIETHQRLKDLGIDISFATVKNYKAQIKAQASSWIASLARSRRGNYIAQYRERVIEVETIQKKLWDIIEDQKTGSRTQVEASGKLLDCTRALVELYDCLPLINSIRDYDTAQEYKQQRQEHQDRIDATSLVDAIRDYDHDALRKQFESDYQGQDLDRDNNNNINPT